MLPSACVSLRTSLLDCFRNPQLLGRVMGLSGLPSLLAVAGLLGFAFVEMLLPY